MTNERAVALIVEAVRDPNMKQSASPLRKAIEAINIRHALSESELAEIQAKLQARGLSTQINSPQPEAAIQAIFLAMKAASDPQLNRDELYGDILETSLKLELMTVEKFGSRQGIKIASVISGSSISAFANCNGCSTAILTPNICGVSSPLDCSIGWEWPLNTSKKCPLLTSARMKRRISWRPTSDMSATAGEALSNRSYARWPKSMKTFSRRAQTLAQKRRPRRSLHLFRSGDPGAFQYRENGKRLTDKGASLYRPESIMKALPPSRENA